MWILSPLSWLVLWLGVYAFGNIRHWNRRWLLRICGTGTILSITAMTPMFANWLVAWLEVSPPQASDCAVRPPSVAVVLAGGVDGFVRMEQDTSALSIASRRRADSAAEWWSLSPGRQLVVAGGSGYWGGAPESVLMSRYLQRLGVPAAAIRIESESRDTWQNAHNVAALRPALPREIVLVTSAMHMRRARYSMQEAGFTVCPLYADRRYVPFRRPSHLLPDSGGLAKTEAALHELVGLAYYHWR